MQEPGILNADNWEVGFILPSNVFWLVHIEYPISCCHPSVSTCCICLATLPVNASAADIAEIGGVCLSNDKPMMYDRSFCGCLSWQVTKHGNCCLVNRCAARCFHSLNRSSVTIFNVLFDVACMGRNTFLKWHAKFSSNYSLHGETFHCHNPLHGAIVLKMVFCFVSFLCFKYLSSCTVAVPNLVVNRGSLCELTIYSLPVA